MRSARDDIQLTSYLPSEQAGIDTDPDGKSSAAISDQLFLEMCRTSNKAMIYAGTDKEEQINWYYAETAAYARRMSAGDFRGKNAKYKPVFHLELNSFSSELKTALAERARTSNEAIHRVVEDGVFKQTECHFTKCYRYKDCIERICTPSVQCVFETWHFDGHLLAQRTALSIIATT